MKRQQLRGCEHEGLRSLDVNANAGASKPYSKKRRIFGNPFAIQTLCKLRGVYAVPVQISEISYNK